MLTIAKHQLLKGLRDAEFMFVATLVLLSFILNAFIYSERYKACTEDYAESIRTNTNMLAARQDNLMELVHYPQQMVKPPSALAFIADGGETKLPDTWTVNAFIYRDPDRSIRGNRLMPVIGSLDWSFIVGTLMTLLAVLISFGAVCGEKRDGTLRMMLSFPVSRMSVFLGNYLGLLTVLIITFLVGASINVGILLFNSALPATGEVLTAVGWAVALSVLCLSFFLLASLAVSSMVARPAVALVVLLVGWVLIVVAVPGLARLIAEQAFPVRSNFEVGREVESAIQEITDSQSDRAFTWYGDPYHEDVPWRAEWKRQVLTARQSIEDDANGERIRQANLINTISMASPSGLLGVALQELSGTGITGFVSLMRSTRRYQQQLHVFTVERDRLDPNSPHLVYSYGTSSDTGVFSQLPVEMSIVPRSQRLWREGGLPMDQSWPALQFILILVGNLQMAILAFIALARYDPR